MWEVKHCFSHQLVVWCSIILQDTKYMLGFVGIRSVLYSILLFFHFLYFDVILHNRF